MKSSAAQRSLQEHKHCLTPAPAPDTDLILPALREHHGTGTSPNIAAHSRDNHESEPVFLKEIVTFGSHFCNDKSNTHTHTYTLSHTHTHTHTHSLSHTHTHCARLFISVVLTIIRFRSLTGVCPFRAGDSRSADRTE